MHTFDNEIMNLVDALKSEMREGDDTTLQRTKTYLAGEYVYGISIDNRLDGRFDVDIHVQWPRLHRWILQAQQEGKTLLWSHTALYDEEVHVHVGSVGSIINYTAIVDRATLVDMLKTHGHDPDVTASATALWKLVLKYECL